MRTQNKLLVRPPFRFIHEVVTATIRATGIAAGLYDDQPDLQDCRVVTQTNKSRARLEFLRRIFLFVELYSGDRDGVVAIEPTNVTAGRDPQITNVWLQKLAAAATSVDVVKSAKCVARVLATGFDVTDDMVSKFGAKLAGAQELDSKLGDAAATAASLEPLVSAMNGRFDRLEELIKTKIQGST